MMMMMMMMMMICSPKNWKKIDLCWGFAPDPTGGAYSAPRGAP